jgi:hypothetical protein
VSRRQTSGPQLSAVAPEICVQFIRQVQFFIDLLNIKDESILTLTMFRDKSRPKRRRHSQREEAVTSYSRMAGALLSILMVAFTVSAAGHMLKPHVLFNKLKNKPDFAPGFLVDAN